MRHEIVCDSGRDEQLPSRGRLLHTRRGVDAVAERGEVHHRTTDVADVRGTRVDRRPHI
jgi:hypothetical protein